MEHTEEDPRKREILKGHLVVAIIRAQEEADRAEAECRKPQEISGREGEGARLCRKKVESLQRKAACYMKEYESLKKKDSRTNTRKQDRDPRTGTGGKSGK